MKKKKEVKKKVVKKEKVSKASYGSSADKNQGKMGKKW